MNGVAADGNKSNAVSPEHAAAAMVRLLNGLTPEALAAIKALDAAAIAKTLDENADKNLSPEEVTAAIKSPEKLDPALESNEEARKAFHQASGLILSQAQAACRGPAGEWEAGREALQANVDKAAAYWSPQLVVAYHVAAEIKTRLGEEASKLDAAGEENLTALSGKVTEVIKTFHEITLPRKEALCPQIEYSPQDIPDLSRSAGGNPPAKPMKRRGP